MRVLLSATHRYPLARPEGSGRNPKLLASGSGQHIHDLIARGLAELGHQVWYCLPGADAPMPPGVTLVTRPMLDVDLVHTLVYKQGVLAELPLALPKIATCHINPALVRDGSVTAQRDWVYVSKQQARQNGSTRFVRNGIDPAHYVYGETKDTYLLYMGGMKWHKEKGLAFALSLAKRHGIPMVVAGTGIQADTVAEVSELCRTMGADYVGDIRGKAKADLLAGARALVLPTTLAEGGPLVIAEALMSGTPVITSDRGGCPEMVGPNTGFVCRRPGDYDSAIEALVEIDPARCRTYAFKHCHYHRMVRDYLVQYRREEAYVAQQLGAPA